MRVIERLMRKYKSRDPFYIADCLGYIIINAPLMDVRGFYQYVKRNHIIYLDSDLREQDARFVCAHELGHALLHRGANRVFLDTRTFLVSSKYEKEADMFASFLLVSDDDLTDAVACEYTTQQIATQFCLPEQLVSERFKLINNRK